MPSLSPPGRHVTAAEALQLGIVDQVTEHNAVDVAVKFALSVTGKARKKREREGEERGSSRAVFLGGSDTEKS